MNVYYFLRFVLKEFPLLFTANISLMVITGMIDAVSIFSIAPIIDFLINPDISLGSPVTRKIVGIIEHIGFSVNLVSLLSIFLIFYILRSIFSIFFMYSIFKTKYAVLRHLIIGTFEDFFRARWFFFSSSQQGAILNTFNREISGVGTAFISLAQLCACIIQTAFMLSIPFYLSWQVASISLTFGIILSLPFFFLGKISYRWGENNTSTANKFTIILQESLGLAKVILGFGNQSYSIKELTSAYDIHQKATIKSQTFNAAIPRIFAPLTIIIVSVTILISRWFMLPISAIVIILYSFYKAIPSIGEITNEKTSIDNNFPSYDQVNNFRKQAQKMKQTSGIRKYSGFANKIAFKDVSFAYPGGEIVLHHLNMVIPKGKMIAFVGDSGAGKSTLIDMIMGFNEPTNGEITIDSDRLHDYDIISYRRRLGYVPQDSILFNLSIKDNLLWAKEDAIDQELISACRQANAYEFITSFPEGYNTLVGDRGIRLSGGQCQRIALARAILRKPDLLILDEATSSLDTQSERLIQQAIESIAQETTIIIVAHRLSTITSADYIYVLEKGRIIEEGTYQSLIHIDGKFSQMVKLQTI
jgi:ATP-binding cassette subfamily B protein